jgi:hypothetical protein
MESADRKKENNENVRKEANYFLIHACAYRMVEVILNSSQCYLAGN